MSYGLETGYVERAKARNIASGGHYFDRDSMRFFGSRTHYGLESWDGSTVIVMSNRDTKPFIVDGKAHYVLDGRRHYYLIRVLADGSTEKLPGYELDYGESTGFWWTLDAARKACRRVVAELDASHTAIVA